MKTLIRISLTFLLLAGLAFGQATTTQTTLAAAQAVTDQTISLTSSTGVYAYDGTQILTGIFVDREYEEVLTQIGSTSVWRVRRGVGRGSARTGHVSGAVAWIGPPNYFDQGPILTGACTASLQPNLPRPNIATGQIMDCAGMWSNVNTRLQGSCSGTATYAATLGLYGLGQNLLLTCTSTTVSLGPVMNHVGTVRAMSVTAGTAGSDATSGVFVLYKNGSSTTMTCTVGTAKVCSDLTHIISFVAGDVLAVQVTNGHAGSETLADISAYLVID